MIHRLEIDKDITIICCDKFLEEFNNLLNEEFNKTNMINNYG